MSPKTALELIELGTEAAKHAINGTAPSSHALAKRLVSIGLDLVPVDDLRAYLSAESRRRIDEEIDAEIARG